MRGQLSIHLVSLASIVVVSFSLPVETGAQRRPRQGGSSRYRSDEILVRLRAGAPDVAARMRSAMGASLRKRFRARGLEVWRLRGMRVEDALAAARTDPDVLYAEPNYRVYALQQRTIPTDPDFARLWALDNLGQTGGSLDADIDAPEAWTFETGSSTEVVVGVVDTGVDWAHPDLAANIWVNPGEIAGNGIDDDRNGYVDDTRGWDFVNDDNNPMDDNVHGTHVAGTIAAVGNNDTGATGVSWHAKIMPLKFLDADGSGFLSDAIEAIEYATDNGARLTNNSWGGGGFSRALRDSIAAAERAGLLFVAAAGNDGRDTDDSPAYPASYTLDAILSVAATDHNDARTSFSNFGLESVDLGAPGSRIVSTAPGGGYRTLSGTSMASPHVAGAAALVWSAYPNLTADQVKALLLGSVDAKSSLSNVTLSGGRLNLANAVGRISVSITRPADRARFLLGSNIVFTGVAAMRDGTDVSSRMQWSSSIDGSLGAGASFSTTQLSLGVHSITAFADDVFGRSGSDVLTLEVVNGSNQPPSVRIDSPTNGSVFPVGSPVVFVAAATDPEDGIITNRVQWVSSINGALGVGGTLSVSTLSLGIHSVTATVLDNRGLSAAATVNIEIRATPGAGGAIDWNTKELVSYSNQDRSGALTIEDGGRTFAMVGNRWRRTTETFTITPFTVLEFEFESSVEGEIHAIGFDEDDALTNGLRLFQLHGTQRWSGALQTYSTDYTTIGSFKKYSIPVGAYYRGSGFRLVLVNDRDFGVLTNTSRFRNVRVFELRPSIAPVDWTDAGTVSYSNQDVTGSGSVAATDAGRAYSMLGNRWRRTTRTFTITRNTVVDVTFSSSSEGEIHGIGLDENDALSDERRIFQLHGTQRWSGAFQDFYGYSGGTVTYRIPVGRFLSGSGFRLVLVNDKDSVNQTNTSLFSDIRIFEIP